MSLIHQPGGRCDSSFRLGIVRSVTADENEKKANPRVRGTGHTTPVGFPPFLCKLNDEQTQAARS